MAASPMNIGLSLALGYTIKFKNFIFSPNNW